MLTLELLRGIKEISNNNNVPESWSKEQVKWMQEYKQQGYKFGNSVEGYRKWLATQRKCVK